MKQIHYKTVRIALLLVFLLPMMSDIHGAAAAERRRVVVQTDIGGDPDDQATFVRFLMYSNEWDIEGIIGDNDKAISGTTTGLEVLKEYIDAYDKVDENLRLHDSRYPTADFLRSKVVQGWDGTTAKEFLEQLVKKPDSREIWYCNWGTRSAIREAFKDYFDAKDNAGYREFLSHWNFFTLGGGPEVRGSDEQGRLVNSLLPSTVSVYVETGEVRESSADLGGKWYHQFGAVSDAAGTSVASDIKTDHGPFAALYTIPKEGDSWTVMLLIPTGLNNHLRPDWGGWAGRYGVPINPLGGMIKTPPYYWPNQKDTWNGETSKIATVKRWADAAQGDFLNRLDWCVMSYAEANHRPVVLLNGKAGLDAVAIYPKEGETVALDAAGTKDPDAGDNLTYEWIYYKEAGTYTGDVTLKPSGDKCTVTVPADAKGKEIHVICQVTDDGSRKGNRIRNGVGYRRAVLYAGSSGTTEPLTHRLPSS